LVGTNSGTVHACYCTGDISVGETAVGTLIDSGEDKSVGCYIASEITSFTDAALKNKVEQLNVALSNYYSHEFNHTRYQFTHVSANYPTVIVANR